MSKKQKPPATAFDSTNAAKLIPGQVDLQKDCMGRPIHVGDRVDDTTAYVGGVVVSVFGETCVFLTDYDGDFGMGRFTAQNCDELRLLPPVTDIETFVAETLAYRARIEEDGPPIAKDSGRAPMLATVCTRIRPEEAIDAAGRQVEIGDVVVTLEGASCSTRGGLVVGIASNLLLIQDVIEPSVMAFDAAQSEQCVVQPRGGGDENP